MAKKIRFGSSCHQLLIALVDVSRHINDAAKHGEIWDSEATAYKKTVNRLAKRINMSCRRE